MKNAKKPKKGSKNAKKGKKMEKNEYLWAFLLFRNEKVSKKGFLRAKKSPNRPFLDPPKVPYNTNTGSSKIAEGKQKTKQKGNLTQKTKGKRKKINLWRTRIFS